MKRLTRYIIGCAALFLSASCSMRLPQSSVEVPDYFIFATADDTLTVVNADWWNIFGDTVLNRLIVTAVENNRDLKIAASRILQARDNVDVARAEFLPSFTAALQPEGSYSLSAVSGGRAISQQYSALAQMSWDVSLFGAGKNTFRAAQSSFMAEQYTFRATMLTLAADVAATYFQWLQYGRSLEISERSYRLRIEAQQRIDSMYQHGFSSAVELEQARSLTATAAADIPAYRRATEQTALALGVLLGQTPSFMKLPDWSDTGDTDLLLPVSLPDYLPAGLPSDLVERRPDVMEAYYNVAAAAAKARVARAERYPSIQLTGAGGLLTYSTKALVEHNPFYWAASASIVEPLFSFGKLKRNEQIAVESYLQSLYAYEQNVLQALADVETALVAISTYHNQIPKYLAIIEAYSKVEMMTSALYSNGLSNYLDLIDAERNLYSSQLQYIGLLTEQLTAYVDLYKALGGGYIVEDYVVGQQTANSR